MDWLGQVGAVVLVIGIWIGLQMVLRRAGVPT